MSQWIPTSGSLFRDWLKQGVREYLARARFKELVTEATNQIVGVKGLDVESAIPGFVSEDKVSELIAKDPKYRSLKGKLGRRVKSRAWNLEYLQEMAAKESPRSQPGTALLKLLAWLPASARNEVFGQTIADMREDCQEALATGGKWRYRWTWLCGVVSVFMALMRWGVPAALGALKLAKSVAELWKLIR